jgi:hypothetical protein
LLAELHREAEVLGQTQTDGVVVVTARVEARMLGRLRRGGVDVSLGEESAEGPRGSDVQGDA